MEVENGDFRPFHDYRPEPFGVEDLVEPGADLGNPGGGPGDAVGLFHELHKYLAGDVVAVRKMRYSSEDKPCDGLGRGEINYILPFLFGENERILYVFFFQPAAKQGEERFYCFVRPYFSHSPVISEASAEAVAESIPYSFSR